jgi:hypothetical protein
MSVSWGWLIIGLLLGTFFGGKIASTVGISKGS